MTGASYINTSNIITHPSVPRNKLIAETLQQLKYVQRAGQGVDIIYRDMLALGKQMPIYIVYSDAVGLTLLSTLEDKEFVRFLNEEQEKNQRIFGTAEVIILHYLKENKSINLDEAMNLVQLGDMDTRNILNSLLDMGLLEKSSRTYMLTHRVYKALGDDIGYVKDKTVDYIKAKRMIVEYIENEGYITNPVCQELCGYDKRKAQYTREKMVNEKLISIKGKGRGSRYIKTNN